MPLVRQLGKYARAERVTTRARARARAIVFSQASVALNFHMLNGDRMRLVVSPNGLTTPRYRLIGDVARQLAASLRYVRRLTVPPRVRLVLDGQLLHEDRTLSYYNIQNECTLQIVLQQPPIQLFVVPRHGRTLMLHAQCGDTIGTVKTYVHTQTGIPVNQQLLSYGLVQLEDDQTLSHYGVRSGSLLLRQNEHAAIQ